MRCRSTNSPSRSRFSMTFPRTPSARSTNRRFGGSSPKHVEALDSDPSHQRRELTMGFTKPDLPDVDPDTFMHKPLMERMRILATEVVSLHLHREVDLLLRARRRAGGDADFGTQPAACLAVVEPADRV